MSYVLYIQLHRTQTHAGASHYFVLILTLYGKINQNDVRSADMRKVRTFYPAANGVTS